MTPKATGRASRLDGRPAVVLTRTFDNTLNEVWASVTDSARLGRWIGTWTGDPASGSVQFQMNAEGDDCPPATYTIQECTPPRRLAILCVDDAGTWELVLELAATGETVSLNLFQVVHDLGSVENTGPGWEYYLDRLVVAEAGGDASSVDFERDYYPAMREHYQGVAETLHG